MYPTPADVMRLLDRYRKAVYRNALVDGIESLSCDTDLRRCDTRAARTELYAAIYEVFSQRERLQQALADAEAWNEKHGEELAFLRVWRVGAEASLAMYADERGDA